MPVCVEESIETAMESAFARALEKVVEAKAEILFEKASANNTDFSQQLESKIIEALQRFIEKAIRSKTTDETEKFSCPECGKNTMRRERSDCPLLDGTLVKNLDRYHCSSCGTDLFDCAAMREIRRQRGKKCEKELQNENACLQDDA